MLKACISILLMLTLLCCKPNEPENRNILTIWSFTDELERPIERFKKLYPDVEVEYTIIPNEEYLNKIRPVLKSGKNAPDVFTGEFALIKELVEIGYYDDLSKPPYNADVSNLVEYQVEIGTDSNGVLRALSWQTTPGGFFYRRSYAKKYLGTDDPDTIGRLLSTTEGFLDVARKLKSESNGTIKIIGSHADYMWFPLSLRKQPYVDRNNNFIIDPEIMKYFDMSKTLRNEQLTAETPQWGPAWFDGMKTNGNIFGYVLPTWGLHYVLKGNSPETSGDWGLTNGPAPYFWGGTWLGIYRNSANKGPAWNFVKMMTLDEEFLEWWAVETGDFIGNQKVFNRIKDSFSEEFLAGQNHYAFFAKQVGAVNADLVSRYDLEIRNMMMQAVSQYLEDNMTKEEAVKYFKDNVKSAYPHLNVK